MKCTYPKFYNYVNSQINGDILYKKYIWFNPDDYHRLGLNDCTKAIDGFSLKPIKPNLPQRLPGHECIRLFDAGFEYGQWLSNKQLQVKTEEILMFLFLSEWQITLSKISGDGVTEPYTDLKIGYKKYSNNKHAFDNVFLPLENQVKGELFEYLTKNGRLYQKLIGGEFRHFSFL